ncbi:hypothetical protein GGI13_002648 [Coemansia sp. RSA 455]|nr:hypothetical protein GGI13_002648 [Coemansia sp. RSA 455]
MSSFSIGNLVRWLADVVSKLALFYSFGSTALLLGSILYGFWSPSMPWGHYKDTHQLSWQEPFSYEAKVYASLSPSFPVNESSSFFETAQLLWHIPPQSVENRYPLLRHKAVVNVPNLLLSGSDLDQSLYAYMFIQEAGQFRPHPDMSDPRLVSSRIPIARWKGTCPSNSSDEDTSATCSEVRVPELQYVSGASWAIVLENHAYPWGDMPKHIPRASTPLLGIFYNPPLLRNDLTKRRPESKPLATLNDKGLAADEYPTTIDVEFELAGIKQGWVLARAHLDEYLRPTLKTVHVEKLVPAPWDPTKRVTLRGAESVSSDGLIPLDAVRRLSVPLALVFVLSRKLIETSFPLAAQMLLHLDSMPASKWTGVSRAAIASLFIGTVANDIQLVGKFGVHILWMRPSLLVVAYIVISMDDMTFAQLAALSWLLRTLFRRKSLSSITNQSSAQEQAQVDTDKGGPDPVASEVAPYSHSNCRDHVVAIRQSIDESSMYWIHLLTIQVFATVVVYCQEYNVSLPGIVNDIPIGCIRIVKSVAWLPQIIVNYKAKYGSFVPMAFAIPMLAYSIASTITYQLSGYSIFGEISVYSFPVYLCYVILIVQWLMYRKVKQD